MAYWEYPPYVSVAEKKAKAAKKLEQLMKKNPNIAPVVVEGRTIARTWWGKSWNTNLERYADYSNRIGRGRSYVCNGMVLDLQIASGAVTALVQGTRAKPYSVSVQIEPIKIANWRQIKNACQGTFGSLPELLEGKFPKSLGEIFMASGKGLFPTPNEIKFSCSCPDWASMCKHVAAALYGIGARLDHDPMLFFTLRNADVNELISHAVEDKTRQLLGKAGRKSARVINEGNLSDIFGIELDEPVAPYGKAAATPEKPRRKKTVKKGEVQPPERAKPAGRKKQAREAGRKKTPKTAEASGAKTDAVKQVLSFAGDSGRVEAVIGKSRKGIGFPALLKKTGIAETRLRNIIFQLRKSGRIVTPERGLYKKA